MGLGSPYSCEYFRRHSNLVHSTLSLAMSSPGKPRFAAYRTALTAISSRTGTPLPSLLLSFGVLHELTAVVPLVGFFYGARMMGLGERVVAAVIEEDNTTSDPSVPSDQFKWAKLKMREWVQEGDRWAIRIGRRYGVFGYEKRAPGSVDDVEQMAHVSGHLAGDVANAVVAYGATKVRDFQLPISLSHARVM